MYRQGRPIYCPFSTKKTSAPREPLCMRPCSFRLSVAILFMSIPSWIVIRMSISLGFSLSVHIDPIRATRLIPSSFLISPTNHCVQSKRTDRSVRKLFSSNDWIFWPPNVNSYLFNARQGKGEHKYINNYDSKKAPYLCPSPIFNPRPIRAKSVPCQGLTPSLASLVGLHSSDSSVDFLIVGQSLS